jgi:uncharacterized delta-60 repeat protein
MLPPSAGATESLDLSFGEGGISFPDVSGASIDGLAEDATKKLVAGGGGFESFVVGRYLSNGNLDESFGRERGTVTSFLGIDSRATSVALQPDGKVIAAGSSFPGTILLARYLTDGKRDSSFGKNGSARVNVGRRGGGALDVALLPTGRILAAGWGVADDRRWEGVVVAFKANGSIDTRFGDGGIVSFTAVGGEESTVEIDAMRTLPSGRILLAGEIAGRVMVVRLLGDGRPDPSFSGDGFAYVNVGRCRCRYAYTSGLALDRRGRIVVSASLAGPDPEPAALLRFMPGGRLDRSFGEGGVVSTFLGSRLAAQDVVVQHNGRIVIAGDYNVPGSGEARLAAVRYLPDGRVDRSFGRKGFFTRDFGVEGVAYAALVQRDGRVVIGGRVNPKPSPFHENESVFDTAEVFLARFLP